MAEERSLPGWPEKLVKDVRRHLWRYGIGRLGATSGGRHGLGQRRLADPTGTSIGRKRGRSAHGTCCFC